MVSELIAKGTLHYLGRSLPDQLLSVAPEGGMDNVLVPPRGSAIGNSKTRFGSRRRATPFSFPLSLPRSTSFPRSPAKGVEYFVSREELNTQ